MRNCYKNLHGWGLTFFLFFANKKNGNKEREKRDCLRTLCVGNPLAPCGRGVGREVYTLFVSMRKCAYPTSTGAISV